MEPRADITYLLLLMIGIVSLVIVSSSGTTEAPEECDCDCEYYDKLMYWENKTKYEEAKKANATPEEKAKMEEEEKQKLESEVKETKGKLVLNATNLASNKMKFTSAHDDRASATNVGIIGCVMMSTVGVALIVCDLASIARHLRPLRKNLGWIFK